MLARTYVVLKNILRILDRMLRAFLILVLLVVTGYSIGKLSVVYLHNKAVAALEQGDYEQAQGFIKRAININPGLAQLHYTLALVYSARGRLTDAVEEYRQSIRLDPDNTKAYVNIAKIYMSQGDYPRAMLELEAAKIASPSSVEADELSKESVFKFTSSRLQEGIDVFLGGDKRRGYSLIMQAIEAAPDFAYAHYVLGYFYFTDDNLSKAEEEAEAALRRDGNLWMAQKLIGDIHFQKGEYEDALKAYKATAALNNDDAVLYNDMGLACMQMEKYSEGIYYLKEAFRLNPGNANILYSLASVYRDRGMFREAQERYRQLIRMHPDYPNVHNDLAGVYENQKRHKEALDEYALEIKYSLSKLKDDPADPFTLNNLAYAYIGIKEYAKAEEEIKKAISLRPGYREAYITLARLREAEKDYSAALEALEKARALTNNRVSFIDKSKKRIYNLKSAVYKK